MECALEEIAADSDSEEEDVVNGHLMDSDMDYSESDDDDDDLAGFPWLIWLDDIAAAGP